MKKTSDVYYSLTKFISQAGVCARRKAVDLIKGQQVTVNGRITDLPETKVTHEDVVRVRGTVVTFQEPIYLLMNKPQGVITSVADDQGRMTVMHLFGTRVHERVYPVGRLDKDTTGVLLFTNDGQWAQKLAHPRYGTEKIYHAELHRPLDMIDLQRAQRGVRLSDGYACFDKVSFIAGKSRRQVMVTLHSGKYHVVRRVFAHLGYTVKKLDRVSFAGLNKKKVALGGWRYLTKQEIKDLKENSKKHGC